MTAHPKSDAFVREMIEEFPSFRIVKKRGNRLQHAIDRFLRIVTFGGMKTYLTRYHTVLFGALSLPDADHQRLPAGGVRVDVVPGAGHSMAHEAPAALAACVARALEAGA